MKTWDEYKAYAKSESPESRSDIEEAEELAQIVSAVIKRRNDMGISQRELAKICGIPQSSVARIESFKTTPNLDTLLKITSHLGLKLTVSPVS